jgi:hypothetical protein
MVARNEAEGRFSSMPSKRGLSPLSLFAGKVADVFWSLSDGRDCWSMVRDKARELAKIRVTNPPRRRV